MNTLEQAAQTTAGSDGLPEHAQVAIAGSGFSGLGMAIALKQNGVEDFVVLERADDVGGTWRDNSYPGCQCDVPSHLYSFSFAPNPAWTRTFSRQPEIHAYLQRCAQAYAIAPHLHFGHELLDASWQEEDQRWRIRTSRGEMTADLLVSGVGALSEPSIPSIPGLDRFQGVAFHSAAWDHAHDLRGRRVAVIGTGASTVQIVPRIAGEVEQLTLFQRTPPWVMPHPDRPTRRWERRLYRRWPGAQQLMRNAIFWARESFVIGFMHPRIIESSAERIARRHLRRQVPDLQLRRKLTPSYRLGCKRVLLSNEYFPALARPNVEVVTEPIAEVREHAIVTANGVEHDVDTIVLGTGFHVTDMPVAKRIHGRQGRSLEDVWAQSMQAHVGTTVAGFPNLFMLLGPNTGLGHNSVVLMIEAQIGYVMSALATMRERGLASVEPTPEAQAAYNQELQRRMAHTVWTTGGCKSWYLDATGRNRTLWPGFVTPFRRRARDFDLVNYTVRPRAQHREVLVNA